MKKLKLIIRDTIEGVTSDKDLRSLNGYFESTVVEFPDEASNNYTFETLYGQLAEECKHILKPGFELIKID